MRISHYEIQGELARGGMGIVYRATDVRSNASVVVKLLKVDSAQSRRRLAREAEAMQRLVHPSVVTLYDSGEHEGSPYLVLPYVEGESLQDRLDREGSLPVEEAIQIAIQVGEGLQAAHAIGLLHRDVKPANVLVDHRLKGNVKLTDFGLVKDVGPGKSAAMSLSVRGRFLGTPGYLPKEQALGKLDLVGPPADVYALGALLYALLTGRPPRSAENLIQAVAAFGEPLEPLDESVPRWLDDLVHRCLENEPSERPGLEAVLAALVGEVPLPSAVAVRPGHATRSHRGAWAAGGVGVAGLAALCAWAAGLGSRSAPTDAVSSRSQAEAIVELGVTAYDEDRYEEVVELCDRALALDADLGLAWSYRGASLGQLGRWAEASEALDRAVRLVPDHAPAWLHRGQARKNQGRYVEAIKDYDRAIELDPLSTAAYARRALCKAELGLRAEAIADCDRAIELDPQCGAAYVYRGFSKLQLNRYAEAIEDFDRGIEIDSSDRVAHFSRGVSKALLGRDAEAIEDYDTAIEFDPQYSKAYYRRGDSKKNLGRHAEAIEDCNRAIELDPKSALAYNTRGLSKANLGRYAEAIEDYGKAIGIDPRDGFSYVGRGACMSQLGRYAEAIEDYDKASEFDLSAEDADTLKKLRAGAAAKLQSD